MKYIDRFKNFLSKDRKDIYDWCVNNNIHGFDIRNERSDLLLVGLINVELVYLKNMMKELPYKFGKVSTFKCSNLGLETAKNFPLECSYLFCNNNNLTSLKGIGKVSYQLDCNNNKLTSLDGLSKADISYLDCSNNLLTSLKGMPKVLKKLDCSYNKIAIINIDNIDDIDINFYGNPIYELCSFIFEFYKKDFPINRTTMNKKNIEILKLLNEYNVIRGNKIMLDYLMEVLYMINTDYKKVMNNKPRASLEDLYKIEGYEIIK